MTTETSAPSGTPHRATGPVVGLRSLVGSALVCLVVALVLALIAAYAGGGWWWASLTGSMIAIAVFLLGASLVALVAAVLPQASLMFALLTYALEVVALAAVFVGLRGLEAFETDAARLWLGGSVIAVTLTWTAAHLAFATRRRIPAYDLPAHQGADPAGGNVR